MNTIDYNILDVGDGRDCTFGGGFRGVGKIIDADEKEICLDNFDSLLRDSTHHKAYGTIYSIKPWYGEVWLEGETFLAQIREKGVTVSKYSSPSIEGILRAVLDNHETK
jgi:hypothetical protein